jgi:hypothetical protein
MNKNVVVDIDGVLADFEGKFVQTFGDERRELESLESRYPNRIHSIRGFVNDMNTYTYLDPIPLGLSIVDFLNDNGFDVDIVTSRPLDTEWVTRRWLKKNNVRFLSFGVYPNKIARIAELCPICAVDDLISVSRHLTRYSVPVLLMQHPWNWFYDLKNHVFSNLSQFITCFNQIITKGE